MYSNNHIISQGGQSPWELSFYNKNMKKYIAIFASLMLAAPMMAAEPAEEMTYSRTETKWASTPKFGGYFIGKYIYSDQDGAKGGAGFEQRLIRAYVDGTILGDFKYRIQVQMNNKDFHMKDFFVEWQKYKFAMVKVGQFKRAFGYENPMNPWDTSTGDYGIYTRNMTSDYDGKSPSGTAAGWGGGGRDMGIQVQGDFLKVGSDNHNLIHYQVGLWNGQGINTKDLNGKKDLIGTIQFQPIKGLSIGAFGWHGSYSFSATSEPVEKNRYAFGAKYDNKGWCARAEWGHSQQGTLKHDTWYVVGAMPINDWFRICAEYQTYRANKSWSQAQCIYSLMPEFQLHKNLKFQIQYNWNDVRANRFTKKDVHYNEIIGEFYVRF